MCSHRSCCVAVGVHGAGPSAPGSNPVETSAIFPGSDAIGLASPAKELGVARATVQYLDAWTQQNAFPQIFGAAGRVFHGDERIPSLRVGGDVLMRTFERVINQSMTQGNLWHKEGGGNPHDIAAIWAAFFSRWQRYRC